MLRLVYLVCFSCAVLVLGIALWLQSSCGLSNLTCLNEVQPTIDAYIVITLLFVIIGVVSLFADEPRRRARAEERARYLVLYPSLRERLADSWKYLKMDMFLIWLPIDNLLFKTKIRIGVSLMNMGLPPYLMGPAGKMTSRCLNAALVIMLSIVLLGLVLSSALR